MDRKHVASTLCLVNGNIITMNPNNPKVEAVVIWEEMIIGVGTNEEIKTFCDETTKIIDLEGKTVLPGFIDCHIHLLSRGTLLKQLDLRDAKSIDEIKDRIREEASEKPPGTWIVGQRWDDNTFLTERRFPTRWDLDEVAPNHPVILIRVCGHITVANSKAMELENVTSQTESPPGGQIDKDPETNEPTGVLRESAGDLISQYNSFTDEEYLEALKAACELAVSKGITSIHCLPSTSKALSSELKFFQTLLMRDELPLRVYLMIQEPLLNNLVDLGFSTGFGNSKLRIGGIKVLLDGCFGGRTAAMLSSYIDDPENDGILIYTADQLHEIIKTAHNAGFQLGIHCIGDRAAQIALDTIEDVLKENPRENSRHRLEHASCLNPELIQRMRKLGVVGAVQPPFIVADGDWITDRLGEERTRYVYPFKTMLNEGVKLAAGSDCPVINLDPLPGIQDAVLRVTADGNVFVPEERVSIEEAIRMYTLDAAYGSFEEHIKGSIEPGKLADIVILSKSPLDVPKSQIGEINVEMTIVGGKVVYSKSS